MPRDVPIRLKALATKLRLERDWYLMLVAGVIGFLMSGVAMAFILPLRGVERLAEHVAENDPLLLWWLVPIVPMIGALAAGVVHTLIPSEGQGPGVTKVMYAIHRGHARIPWHMMVRKWVASTCTIASGGSAGAEGPIVTIGAVIGSITGRVLRVNPQSTATLLGCGAAAGIASVFNAPIAGVFFVLEILLRDFSLRTFTPIVIASVISSAVTQAVLGNEPLFNAAALFAVDEAGGDAVEAGAAPAVESAGAVAEGAIVAFTWSEIPNYLILGVLCGVCAAMFIRAFYATSAAFSRLRVPAMLRPMVGAALLGLLGLGSLWFLSKTGAGGRVPDFYGNGYPVIKKLLTPSYYYTDASLSTLKPFATILVILIALGVLKALATCLTVGSGGAGGMFAPSMLLGAAVGGTFGYVVEWIGWFPSASPAHYALVGMAAMVAASTHAPLTGILIVYEITRSYEVILPLMLAAVISTIVGRLVYRDSVYTVKLTDQGIRLGEMSDLTILRRLQVSDVPLVAPVFVHPDDSAQRLLVLSEKMSVQDFVVTDRRDRYVGLVTGADLKEALVYRESIPLLQVSELQREDLPTVTSEETLDRVLEKFAQHDVSGLAVLGDKGDGAVTGLITRSRLMHRYRTMLDEQA